MADIHTSTYPLDARGYTQLEFEFSGAVLD